MKPHQFSITSITASALIVLASCSSESVKDTDANLAPVDTPRLAESLNRVEHSTTATATATGIATNNSLTIKPGMRTEKRVMLAPQNVITNVVAPTGYPKISNPQVNRERYAAINTNPLVVTIQEPTSTFSIDVDTGAYANVRRFLNSGTLPPEDAVRVEEMVNYFNYDYPQPDTIDTPFSITTELAGTPWNDKTHLLHIGLNGYDIEPSPQPHLRPPANLVFLIDVSGSMSAPGKLGLVKPAMQMLVNELTEEDTVSIAVYAGASGVALEPTSGDQKTLINQAIQSLQPGGSTHGHAGIELAYALANENKTTDSVNRIILVTDGDFNVGISDTDQLKKLIETRRKSGIALSTLGFGIGNFNDQLMEQLADVGNGAYAYIDTLNEARKVLVDELTGSLLTIAKDVKIQVEFNPSVVSEYRLIGYENRALANEDFNDDNVDAGEIGAGHTVTALYEVALVGDGGERNSAPRYTATPRRPGRNLDEVAELRIRYKNPDDNNSQLIEQLVFIQDVKNDPKLTSDNFKHAASVAAFGQHLRGVKYLNNFSLDKILTLALSAQGNDPFGYRQEFVNLVRLAKSLQALSSHSFVIPRQKEPRG